MRPDTPTFCLGLSFPAIMGVVNVTEDSFSDGGRWNDPAVAVAHAKPDQDEEARTVPHPVPDEDEEAVAVAVPGEGQAHQPARLGPHRCGHGHRDRDVDQ